jgi:membrane protein implicated in regulation of membrane protease activity
MFIIGLLLLAVAVVVAIGLLIAPGGSTSIGFFGLSVEQVNSRTVLAAGLLIAIVGLLGLAMMRTGIARGIRRRRERRALRDEADAARDEADAAQQAAATQPAPATPPAPATQQSVGRGKASIPAQDARQDR